MELEPKSNVAFIILKSGEKIVSEVHTSEGELDVVNMVNPMELVVFDDAMTGASGFSFKEWVPKAFVVGKHFPIRLADTYGLMVPTPMLEKFYMKVMKAKIPQEDEPATVIVEGEEVPNLSSDPMDYAILDAIEQIDHPDKTKSEVYEYILKNLNPKAFTVH